VSDTRVTWEQLALSPADIAELRRIEESERAREAGRRHAAVSRQQQQLPEHTEVQLWETE